jgi:nucleoside-diphosphate kinase
MATERTLALIKSGALSRNHRAAIMSRIQEAGLRVVTSETIRLVPAQCAEFYAEHIGRPFYDGLVGSVTGPDGVVAVVIEGENAIQRWRDLQGKTNPADAAPGTIRRDFGLGMPDNATHGSDSPESAAREIGYFFPDLAFINGSEVIAARRF